MKKLVTAKEVEASAASGQKVLYVDDNTIITPAAKDAAREAGITISTGTPQPEPEAVPAAPAPAAPKPQKVVLTAPTAAPAEKKTCATCSDDKSKCATCASAPADGGAEGKTNIDLDVIYKVLKVLMDRGLLNGVSPEQEVCAAARPAKPYSFESDQNGLKVVHGSSIQYEYLKTDNPNNQVYYQEIVNADDGCKMNAGMISIEKCKFGWQTECQELYYVVEGTLKVSAGGVEYTANPGDTVFFPEGVQVTFGSPDKMKAFYATY